MTTAALAARARKLAEVLAATCKAGCDAPAEPSGLCRSCELDVEEWMAEGDDLDDEPDSMRTLCLSM